MEHRYVDVFYVPECVRVLTDRKTVGLYRSVDECQKEERVKDYLRFTGAQTQYCYYRLFLQVLEGSSQRESTWKTCDEIAAPSAFVPHPFYAFLHSKFSVRQFHHGAKSQNTLGRKKTS